ncbi:hypothetical protein VNO78_32787 [Psophocarpus tetragonolobus]|uniref:Pentatricopeptide repeat-containing protein n=1 Tax=Psophocarpus tetragonolobus TaxID=3891 RepID=A0AAN9NVV1_PSOTE
MPSRFDQMPERNCLAWNTVIRALAETQDRHLGALLVFCQMMSGATVEPNQFTFPSVLKACTVMARLEEGKQVHGLLFKFGLVDDEFAVTNLLRMYVMCGSMEDAHVLFYRNVEVVDDVRRTGNLKAAGELFERMAQRSVVSWNMMVSGCAQIGFYREAIEMLHRMMQMRNMLPNRVTVVSVLPAISRLGALELRKWVHLYTEKNRIRIDDVPRLGPLPWAMDCNLRLGSWIMDHAPSGKCGGIEKAIQVFERLPQNNVIR